MDNCYDKYAQLISEEKHQCPNKEDAENDIRFEIQCKNRKLHAMLKNRANLSNDLESFAPIHSDEPVQVIHGIYSSMITRRKNTSPIYTILADATSVEIIDMYFRKIVRSGDYYTLVKARQMIESLDGQFKRKKKLIKALEMTNDHRGIYNTKSKLEGNDLLEYNRMLIDLDKLMINPVTIPQGWGIEYIPNLLSAYYDKCAEVQNEESRREGEKRLLSKKKKKL